MCVRMHAPQHRQVPSGSGMGGELQTALVAFSLSHCTSITGKDTKVDFRFWKSICT